MATWKKRIFGSLWTAVQWGCICVAASILFTACGGGGGGGDPLPEVAPVPVFSPAAAAKSPYTIDGRRIADVSTVGTTGFTVEALFEWAEKWDKDTGKGFFIKGPKTQTGTFGGSVFSYRDYPSGASIHIRQSDNTIFVWWSDKTVFEVGTLAHYSCVVNDCAAPATAGMLVFSGDGGTSITVKPNYKGDKVTWLGADGKGFEILAGDFEEVCWYSDRLNNWGSRGGLGCNKPAADGSWRVTKIPNNDCGQVTAWAKGKLYFLNFKDAPGWKLQGFNAVVSTKCEGVEYGKVGFTPAKVYAVQEADKTATLVWDFGSDFPGGFGVAKLDLENTAVTYAFALNGNHQGKGYGSGWGLGEGRKTPEGFLIAPSVKMAWLENDPVSGNKLLRFRNVACTDKANATVYRGTGPAASVAYDFGKDGFGLAWASVGGSKPLWQAGANVFINTSASQVEYGVPFCTQK